MIHKSRQSSNVNGITHEKLWHVIYIPFIFLLFLSLPLIPLQPCYRLYLSILFIFFDLISIYLPIQQCHLSINRTHTSNILLFNILRIYIYIYIYRYFTGIYLVFHLTLIQYKR